MRHRLTHTLLGLFLSTPVWASESLYNMPHGVTSTSHNIYQLHMTIFWICVAIGIGVFSVMFYALIKHRKSKGAIAASFHENIWVEIVWAIIPFLILVAMAIPATKALIKIEDHSDADINIKITGYQWKWRYDYLDEGFGFMSNLATTNDQIYNKAPKGKWYLLEVDHPLVVPIHKKIRFLVTANDVIHSWWVPELAVKRDAIPGFIHESWTRIEKPGVYRGQCTELCGMHHGFMPIVVIALPEAAYDNWVKKQRAGANKDSATQNRHFLKKTLSKEDLMSMGQLDYAKHCSTCHRPNGEGMPPAFPALKRSKVATGNTVDHIKLVLNGRPGTAMQAFRGQLTNIELAAILTYVRNSWGNDDKKLLGPLAGGLVQSIDIEHAR